MRSRNYIIMKDQLYKKNTSCPWLHFLKLEEAELIINEVHGENMLPI